MKKFWNDTFYTNSKTEKEKSIIGTLNPIRWDKNGRIKQFSVYSEEEDVIIENFQNKRKLTKLLNKRVIAVGKVRLDEEDNKYIKLKSIKELTGPTSPATNLVKLIDAGLWNEEYSLSIPKEYALHQYNQHAGAFWEAY